MQNRDKYIRVGASPTKLIEDLGYKSAVWMMV